MGADMILYVLPLCKYTKDREIEAKWFAENLDLDENESFKDLVRAFQEYNFESFSEDKQAEMRRETIKQIIDELEEYWDLQFRRDVGVIQEGRIPFIVTGGLSWGDDPTEASNSFFVLKVFHDLFKEWAFEDAKVIKIKDGFMDTGTALDIVHAMAKFLYKDHGEFVQAKTPHEVELALDTVEDLIVNNFGED